MLDYKKKRKLFGTWHVFAEYSHPEARMLEKDAHRHFKIYRVTGEVFSIDPDIVCTWLLRAGAIYIRPGH